MSLFRNNLVRERCEVTSQERNQHERPGVPASSCSILEQNSQKLTCPTGWPSQISLVRDFRQFCVIFSFVPILLLPSLAQRRTVCDGVSSLTSAILSWIRLQGPQWHAIMFDSCGVQLHIGRDSKALPGLKHVKISREKSPHGPRIGCPDEESL